jgi:hypothetical protein
MKLKTNTIITIFLSVMLSTAGLARKGTDIPEQREDFMFGIAAGGGILFMKDRGSPVDSYGHFSVPNLKPGWLLSPRSALCLHISSGGHHQNYKTRAFEAVLPAVQYWVKDRLWLLGGAGLSMDMPPFYDVEEDNPKFYFGMALCTSIGYELWKSNGRTIDIQGRLLYGRYEVEGSRRQSLAFSILIGHNWY